MTSFTRPETRASIASTLLALAVAVGLGGAGCSGCDDPQTGPEPVPTFDQCDSEPAAFVRDASLALLGRRPASQREVDAYVALYQQAAKAREDEATTEDPRAVVARALLAGPERLPRWTAHFMDALRVTRTDDQTQERCWGTARMDTVETDLALLVRDHAAGDINNPVPFSMLDLARSAVAADDPTVIYRAHLFALVSQPITAANVPDVEAELARREDFGATFDAAYLNRDIVCLGCHNSEASITDAEDPALDRHWPLAGHVDRAVFGLATGGDPVQAHAVFRVDGFLDNGGSRRPWGMGSECGRFNSPAGVGPDPAGVSGRLASLSGDRLTVFDLDAAFKRGFDALRGGALTVGADGAIADPDAAIAYMVATGIVESVWREVVGTPLTIANYFPRNQAARDVLQQLTDRFVASGFSLDALLVAIVTSDYFSRKPPEAACGAGPYIYPAVYDPWVTSDTDPARRQNGPGDAVAPLSARTLLSAAYAALEWPAPSNEQFPSDEEGCEELSCTQLEQACEFGSCCVTYDVECQGLPPLADPEELPFLRAVGAFLKSGDRGFRGLDFQARLAWEDRFAVCAKPARVMGDDFIDRAVALAWTTPDATVADVAALLKDRLLGEPPPEPTAEGPALEALLGQPLTAPATSLSVTAARRLCGVLLSSPQFVLQGVAGRGLAAAPTLVLPTDEFDPTCARIAAAPPVGWTVTCAPGRLTATPPAPDSP